jgi:hypothetical protein
LLLEQKVKLELRVDFFLECKPIPQTNSFSTALWNSRAKAWDWPRPILTWAR